MPWLPRLLVLRLVSSTTHKYLLNPTMRGPYPHGAYSPRPQVTGTEIHRQEFTECPGSSQQSDPREYVYSGWHGLNPLPSGDSGVVPEMRAE